MRKVLLIYFKQSGKYYTEEFKYFCNDWSVNQIIEYVKTHVKSYKGMNIVGLFNNDDEIGYPFMINHEDRSV